MTKQKLLITIASILLIVGIFGSIFTYKSSSASSEDVTQTEVIANEEITKIDVKTDNAKVEVVPTEGKEIKVEFTSSASDENKYKLLVDEAGDSLSVEVQEKSIQFIFFDLDFDFTGPALKLYLPKKQYEELIIDVVNGKIHAEDITVAHADIKTINGRLEVVELVTEITTVFSENGAIMLEHVDGEITSDVTNGSTTLITKDLDRSIDLESVNGKIKVQTAKEPTNATIEVNVKNGSVDIFGSDSRSVVTGNGENKIRLKTVNGKVLVSK